MRELWQCRQRPRFQPQQQQQPRPHNEQNDYLWFTENWNVDNNSIKTYSIQFKTDFFFRKICNSMCVVSFILFPTPCRQFKYTHVFIECNYGLWKNKKKKRKERKKNERKIKIIPNLIEMNVEIIRITQPSDNQAKMHELICSIIFLLFCAHTFTLLWKLHL